jgi:hypothetical protein
MLLTKSSSVAFDPSNKEHRKAVYLFKQRCAWSDAGIKFSHDSSYSSIIHQVESKLLKWHLEQEFNL